MAKKSKKGVDELIEVSTKQINNIKEYEDKTIDYIIEEHLSDIPDGISTINQELNGFTTPDSMSTFEKEKTIWEQFEEDFSKKSKDFYKKKKIEDSLFRIILDERRDSILENTK
ncbi:hypothetical protein [Maribacter sp. HTCC2170]|uniref:hypothetical protein n=1 Tax=Maribacter sp. (strain HTCC2170 / KCCM 42371) TaxID=313603 RepID=UPI0002FFBAAB|nr:hypothetical protein [Maribacter sp. HTCC2170]